MLGSSSIVPVTQLGLLPEFFPIFNPISILGEMTRSPTPIGSCVEIYEFMIKCLVGGEFYVSYAHCLLTARPS